MKCSIMLHFILVFTVCKSTHLGFSGIYKVQENALGSRSSSVLSCNYSQPKGDYYAWQRF